MRVFLTRAFAKYSAGERLSDASLRDAVSRADKGLVDANLGGGLIKQRVARAGGGKSGGYRTIIAFRMGTLAIFVYGFAKNERDNIGQEELREYRRVAVWLLKQSEPELDDAVAKKVLREITDA
jgi:hypothetical protein